MRMAMSEQSFLRPRTRVCNNVIRGPAYKECSFRVMHPILNPNDVVGYPFWGVYTKLWRKPINPCQLYPLYSQQLI